MKKKRLCGLKGCNEKHFGCNRCKKHYNKLPHVIERKRKYNYEYNRRDYVRKRKRELNEYHNALPKNIKLRKEYNEERKRAYHELREAQLNMSPEELLQFVREKLKQEE